MRSPEAPGTVAGHGAQLATAAAPRDARSVGPAAPRSAPPSPLLRGASAGSGLPFAWSWWGGGVRASDLCGRRVDRLDLLIMSGRLPCLLSLLAKRKQRCTFLGVERGLCLCYRFVFSSSGNGRRGAEGEVRGGGGGLEALCLIGGQGPRRGSARRQRAQRANKRPSLTEPFPEAVAEAVARPRPLAGGLR